MNIGRVGRVMAGKMDIQLLKTNTMSESEIKEAAERYEDAAKEKYSDWYEDYSEGRAMRGFIAGCEYADKEAYNRAIQDAITTLKIHYVDSPETVIEELQKLRK